MKSATVLMAVCASLAAMCAAGGQSAATDPLTLLPLPPADAALNLGEAMKLDATQVCKSTMRANFYTPAGGKVDAALAWYTANLHGFKHTHAYWSGRSQDTFYNADGTLMVSVTGTPAKQGQNADLYSVLYAKIQPGFAEKTIMSLNAQKVICP
jgi:hypothetical protein